MSQECPCCSGEQYSLCCAPYIDGTQIPATAECLMRSRYTAYVQQNAAYLVATWHPSQQRPELLPALTESFAGSEWLGLNVTRCFAGLHENEAFVTFFARYREKAQLHHLHECSRFVREDQRWYYIDGTAPELGRNDPCPCGSGKKYKKCCN